MAGLDRDWNRVVDGSQAAARALAGRALAAAHKRKPGTREGSGPLFALDRLGTEGQGSHFLANDLANMPIRSSGDSGTVRASVEAGGAPQARSGSTEDRGGRVGQPYRRGRVGLRETYRQA